MSNNDKSDAEGHKIPSSICKDATLISTIHLQPRFFSQQFDSNFHVEHFQPKSDFRVHLLIENGKFREAEDEIREAVKRDLGLRRRLASALIAIVEEDATRATLERPPGHRAIVILQAVLPKSVFERVYGQMIADSRAEYYEALAEGDEGEARKVKRHLNYNLVMSAIEFICGLPAHLLSLPFKILKKGDE